MQSIQWLKVLSLALTITLTLALIGCSKKTSDDDDDDDSSGPGPGQISASALRTPVEAKSFGTLKGKITFEGDAAKVLASFKAQMEAHKDRPRCMEGDTSNPAWKIGAENALANVVVFLRAPDGKFFPKPPDERKTWPAKVVVDQPFCAFEPHVSVAFPQFYDPASKDAEHMESTGQIFEVINTATVLHNTRYEGSRLKYAGDSVNLKAFDPKKDKEPALVAIPLKADDTVPVTLNCDVHKWMRGYVWAFEHPYAAVSKPDGTYEIKFVPLDTELSIVVWHEAVGFVNGAKGATIKLKDNDVQNFTVKPK